MVNIGKKFKAAICNPLYQLSHFFIAIILTMIAAQLNSVYATVPTGLAWGTFVIFVLVKIYATASKAAGKLVIVATQVFISPVAIEDNVFTILNTTPIKEFDGKPTQKKAEEMMEEIKTELKAEAEEESQSAEEEDPKEEPRDTLENKEEPRSVHNIEIIVPKRTIIPNQELAMLQEIFIQKCEELKAIASLWGDQRYAVLEKLTEAGQRSLHLCTLDDELQIEGRKFDKCYFVIDGDSFEKACLWETMKVMFPDGIIANAHATKAWVAVLGWLDNIPLLDLAVTDIIFIRKLLKMQQYQDEFLKVEESMVYKNTALHFELLQQKIEIDQLNEDIDYFERALSTVRGVHMRNLMRYENQNHQNLSGRMLVEEPKQKESSSGKWITGIFVFAILIGVIAFVLNGGGIGG